MSRSVAALCLALGANLLVVALAQDFADAFPAAQFPIVWVGGALTACVWGVFWPFKEGGR